MQKDHAICTEYSAHNDMEYDVFLQGIQKQFLAKIKTYGNFLFTTECEEDLFGVFLNHLPVSVRQHYTCNACAKFVRQYGNTVFISEDGEQIPAMWNVENTPELYRESVSACYSRVKKADVSGCFFSDKRTWGAPATGEWSHMAVIAPVGMLHIPLGTPARQLMAEKSENFKMLNTALSDFKINTAEIAVELLKTDSLYCGVNCAGVAEWFLSLHKKISATKNRVMRKNIIWLAAATAPPGYCHIRTAMIGRRNKLKLRERLGFYRDIFSTYKLLF